MMLTAARHPDRRSARILRIVTWCLLLVSQLLGVRFAAADVATGRNGMVATVQPLATQAGLRALKRGGNAVDAAVAAALTLGVVDGHNSGLGGGCFVLIRRPSGHIIAIDGREMAPAAASRDIFLRDGKAVPQLSQFGPLAPGVPGALAAYQRAMQLGGSLELSTFLNEAAEIAEQGFAVDSNYARNLRNSRERLAKFPASRAMLLKPDGTTYKEGETLRLPDLARSYRQMARDVNWFYRGEFAQRTAEWMKANGGLMTADDFANYHVVVRKPVRSRYRQFEVIGFPPPSSGGVHVAQILNTLQHFPLPELLRTDPQQAYHLVGEAMKLAFADRAHWLGDADFAPVPRGLAAADYGKQLAARIQKNKASEVPSHSLPPQWQTDVYGKHTTHIAAADSQGNWVAITATVNTSFGSKVVIPGTGIVLNNEMDDFSAQPGAPNAFGLVGAEANAVAPGKRPLSSMSPTIVLKDGQPVLTLGAAGGPKIITQVVCTILQHLDAGLPLDQAVAAPRVHHQWRPKRLFVESTFPAELQAALKQRGHDVEQLSSGGITQAIARTPEGWFVGVADPRVPGQAAGH